MHNSQSEAGLTVDNSPRTEQMVDSDARTMPLRTGNGNRKRENGKWKRRWLRRGGGHFMHRDGKRETGMGTTTQVVSCKTGR